MSRNFAAFLAGFVLLTACVPNPEMAMQTAAEVEQRTRQERKVGLRAWIEGEKRVHAVGYAMLRQMGPYCQEHYRTWTGARFTRSSEFDQKWTEALHTEFTINDQVQLLYTLPGSPAEMGGLLPGDIPVTLNDKPVDTVGAEGFHLFEQHMATLDKENSAQLLGVQRHGAPLQLLVTPVRVCDLDFTISQEPGRFIFTDYDQVIISQGLLDLLYTDDQLAFVLAQQLVHNIYSHLDDQHRHAMTSATGRKVIELLVQAAERSFNWEFGRHDPDLEQREAMSPAFLPKVDFAALYLVAASGRPVTEAPAFWQRMANGQGLIDFYRPPPTTPERLRNLQNAVDKLNVEFAPETSNGADTP